MGLDSILLLDSFEKYFDIKVSNYEAEKIESVQNMVDCVANHLGIEKHDISLKIEIFEKLKYGLIKNGLTNNSFSFSDKIFSILHPDDQTSWTKLSDLIALQIPKPFTKPLNFIQKVFSPHWQPNYDWKTLTVDQFVTAICAENHEKLINLKSIKSTYEILVVISAITTDCIGVDIYEVQAEKSFINDFGIN